MPPRSLFPEGKIDQCARLKAAPSPFADACGTAAWIAGEAERSTKFQGQLANISRNTHSAIFAEVKVDEELGVIRVTRVVNAVAAGRILNTKTARSQIIGGVVWASAWPFMKKRCSITGSAAS